MSSEMLMRKGKMQTRRHTIQQLLLSSLAAGLPLNGVTWLEAQSKSSPRASFEKAIQAAASRFRGEGAPFAPLLLKPAPDINHLYFAKGSDAWANFYNVPGADTFLPLGDVVTLHQSNNGPNGGGLLVAAMKGFENAVAHPISFRNIANGGNGSVSYFKMNPPSGYRALGICLSNKYQTVPRTDAYWCVKEEFLERAGKAGYWSDSGTGLSDDMNLSEPTFPHIERPNSEDILLTPPTVLWSNDVPPEAWVLRLKKLHLDYPESDAQMPGGDERGTTGKKLGEGTVQIQALPWVAVPSLPGSSAAVFPFFFVAIRDYWQCINSDNTPGTRRLTYTVGTEKTQSQQFQEKTGIKLGVEVGAEADGLSGKFSASYDHELDLTTSNSQSQKTERTEEKNYTVDDRTIVADWQHFKKIEFYNGRGDLVTSAVFRYEGLFQSRAKY